MSKECKEIKASKYVLCRAVYGVGIRDGIPDCGGGQIKFYYGAGKEDSSEHFWTNYYDDARLFDDEQEAVALAQKLTNLGGIVSVVTVNYFETTITKEQNEKH